MNIIRRISFMLILVFSLSTEYVIAASSKVNQSTFKHPGMLQNHDDLEFIKQKVAFSEQPWKDAWENLLRQSYSSLEFQPESFTHVVRGPYGRPSIGDRELSSSGNAAYSHAIQWVITGEKAHANKAIEILNAWSPVLWDFDDNDAKLLAGWTGHNFCNAAEIIRYTDAGWQEKDIEQFERMLLTVYYPLIKNFFPEANGNWDAALIDTMLCIGIFCDDREIFDRATNHYLRGEGNGGITKYIYPSGQCQESTRDQSHTQLGLGELALACRVAWTQGVDLFGAADNRLALGFEYTAKYMLGEEVPCYGTISAQGRSRFSDIYERAYQHYRYVKGIEMPYTERAIERTRSRSWSALTMYKGPLAHSPSTPNGPPIPSIIAAQAGALAEPSAQPHVDAVIVETGQSIQAALDTCTSGGWVILASGLHTLPATLRIPSGLTLAGQGKETILFLDPQLTEDRAGTAIINADQDMHDVTLRDFVVEGATRPRPSRDGNQDRRQRSYQMAPSRAGIAFLANHEGQMHDIHFEHVTVRNCTHNGVAVKGAKNVIVSACDFSDNGSSVVPGHGLQHNLLFTHIADCQITDSRLDTSLWGSGLELTHSRNVKISKNELARNRLNGFHSTESREILVRDNLLEGNDECGILFDAMMDGCRDIEISDNLARNNGKQGISINQIIGQTIQNNKVTDNGQK